MKSGIQIVPRRFVPRLGLLVFLLAPTAALPQVPAPVAGSTAPPPRQVRRIAGPLPVFDFYSPFWITLHHVLYAQARLETARPTTRSQPQQAASAEKKLPLEKLSEAEGRAWASAVAAYEKHWAKSDLLFDTELVRIKDRLEEIGDD